ncbi:uncharacterized protein [Epargyreus clarus]|uniref:uncharacterized protein n=1 Tax=Epargyreus clarus TaxID=520877 RepID=UPI003C2D33D2
MDYTILKNEMLPMALQNKPRWVTCVVCAAGMLIITLSAITVGAFIGYTYCYVEHRSGLRKGNFSHMTKLEIIGSPPEPAEANKDTINSVIFSSVLVSRLIKIGQSLKPDATHLKSDSSVMQKNVTTKCLEK